MSIEILKLVDNSLLEAGFIKTKTRGSRKWLLSTNIFESRRVSLSVKLMTDGSYIIKSHLTVANKVLLTDTVFTDAAHLDNTLLITKNSLIAAYSNNLLQDVRTSHIGHKSINRIRALLLKREPLPNHYTATIIACLHTHSGWLTLFQVTTPRNCHIIDVLLPLPIQRGRYQPKQIYVNSN